VKRRRGGQSPHGGWVNEILQGERGGGSNAKKGGVAEKGGVWKETEDKFWGHDPKKVTETESRKRRVKRG